MGVYIVDPGWGSVIHQWVLSLGVYIVDRRQDEGLDGRVLSTNGCDLWVFIL